MQESLQHFTLLFVVVRPLTVEPTANLPQQTLEQAQQYYELGQPKIG